MKPFIITIDTEGDNQWDISQSSTTKNSRFVPRFQEKCEQYNLKPVYLVDYSMSHDPFLVEFLNDCLRRGTCEVGMHLHAWDTPPNIKIDTINDRPYLVEYSNEIIHEKLSILHNTLVSAFNGSITSHRAGRWIINNYYLQELEKLGYSVDCSITHGIGWNGDVKKYAGNVDYSARKKIVPYHINNLSILEVPPSIHRMRTNGIETTKGLKNCLRSMKASVFGKNSWIRPSLCTTAEVIKMIDYSAKNDDYLEFMMHSSEFMPGGSPYYRTEKDIDELYVELDKIFSHAIDQQCCGFTLKEYCNFLRTGVRDD